MPEPILTAIATALATKAAGSLYDLVKKKFASQPAAAATLAAAVGATPDSAEIQALSNELQRAVDADAEFATQLRAVWRQVTVEQHADQNGVTNSVTGEVGGNVLQARDIHGGVHFGGPQ